MPIFMLCMFVVCGCLLGLQALNDNPRAAGTPGQRALILLPVAAFGAIIMPWFIGLVADTVSLQAGMMCNLLPCAGIMVLSLIISKVEK